MLRGKINAGWRMLLPNRVGHGCPDGDSSDRGRSSGTASNASTSVASVSYFDCRLPNMLNTILILLPGPDRRRSSERLCIDELCPAGAGIVHPWHWVSYLSRQLCGNPRRVGCSGVVSTGTRARCSRFLSLLLQFQQSVHKRLENMQRHGGRASGVQR